MEQKIHEKAARLAEDLKETQTFTALYNQHEALNEDEAAQDLLYEFDSLRLELIKKQRQGTFVPEDAGQLQSLQEQIQELDVFRQYQQARQQAVMLAQQAEQVLSEATGLPFAELLRPPSTGGCSSHSSGGCDCGCSC